jgi:hypothetical protein
MNMPKPILTRDEMRESLRNDIENGEQGHFTSTIVREVGEENALNFMESVRDAGSSYSWKGFMKFLDGAHRNGEMRESGQSSSPFAAYFRLGTHVLVYGGYKSVNLPYTELVKVYPSTTLVEPYASGYRPQMPQKLIGQMAAKQVTFQPRSLVVENEDFGSIFGIKKTAIEDDQTGKFMDAMKQMGENHSVQRQIYFDGFLSGAAYNKAGVSVPAPSYTDPTGATDIYSTTYGNRPTNFTSLTEGGITAGITALETMVQPGAAGQLILVQPDVLYVSSQDQWVAKQLLSSENNASGAASAGNPGGAFAINPIKGELRPVHSPHLKAGSWYIMESKADSLMFQDRHPLETVMESPDAGQSFELREHRYRTFMRWAIFWFEPRFVYQGHN